MLQWEVVVLQFEIVLLQWEVVVLQWFEVVVLQYCEVVVLQRLLQDWLVLCRLTHSCPPVHHSAAGPARLQQPPVTRRSCITM